MTTPAPPGSHEIAPAGPSLTGRGGLRSSGTSQRCSAKRNGWPRSVATTTRGAVGAPTHCDRVASEPRHAGRLSAAGVHHVDFGRPVVASRIGEQGAVRREDGEHRPAGIRREAPCCAAPGRHRPEIVLAQEDDAISVQRPVDGSNLASRSSTQSSRSGRQRLAGASHVDVRVESDRLADPAACQLDRQLESVDWRHHMVAGEEHGRHARKLTDG